MPKNKTVMTTLHTYESYVVVLEPTLHGAILLPGGPLLVARHIASEISINKMIMQVSANNETEIISNLYISGRNKSCKALKKFARARDRSAT